MSEAVNVKFEDLKLMSDSALDFFATELTNGNTIEVLLDDGAKKTFSDQRQWSTFLLDAGLRKPPEKKQVRI